ncbi:MAG TPA: molybdenum cofactor guanylyltransferase [Caulobacteraceae bacterium]|jgi:molybdopterin-guanine dinucleotide biosynthesis protein A
MRMMQPPPIQSADRPAFGLVLAGGRSVRFGGEKAAAELMGKPLLIWAAERLAAACSAVAVNARPGTQSERLAGDLLVLHDRPGDPDGPLAGVRAGLAWAAERGAGFLAVSPCDAPLLPDDIFPRLIAAAREHGAAVAETPDGLQPQVAVWPVSALPMLETALAGGAHPPTWRTLQAAGAQPVRFDDPSAFANVNTREDLAALAARLG